MFEYPRSVIDTTFPAITPTPKPTPPEEEGESEEALTHAPLRGEQGGRPGTLALQSTAACAVSRLVLIAGAKASTSWNESQDVPSPLDAKPFCVAPSLDVLEIGWTISSPRAASALKLELFSASFDAAVATATLTVTKDSNPLEKGADKTHACTGTAVWTKDLLTFSDDAKAEFPDGVPTAKHSPYQLRATLTKSDTSTIPAYPLIATTTFHVVVDSLELEWGDDAHLPAAHNGCGSAHEGTWTDREKKVLKALKDSKKKPTEAVEHQVVLDAPLTNGIGSKSFAEDYAGLWGNGPRIPLVARLLVRRADGPPAEDAAAVKGLEVLWDWEAPAAEGWPRWLGKDPATPADETWKKRCSAADRAFFKKLVDDATREPDLAPPGAGNCPAGLGGKTQHVASEAPAQAVFPAHDGAAALPFKVEALPGGTKRPWAAISSPGADPHGGRTGVLFAPGRIAGDVYRVTAYLSIKQKDGTRPLDKAEKDLGDGKKALREHVEADPEGQRLPKATTGLLRVYRRVPVTYVPFPTTVPTSWIDDTKAYYARAAGVLLDVKTVNAPPGTLRKAETYKDAREAMYRTKATRRLRTDGKDVTKSTQLACAHAFLAHDVARMDDARDFVPMRDAADYRQALEAAFKSGKVQALDLSAAPPPGNPEVKVGTTVGWIVGKAPFGTDKTYYVLAKAAAFTQGQVLKVEGYSYKEHKLAAEASTDKSVTIDAVRTVASAWLQPVFSVAPGTSEQTVKVTFGAQPATTITYSKKVLTRAYSTELSKDAKATLKQALIDAVNAHDGGGGPLKVTIEGKTVEKRDQLRVLGVRTFVQSLLEDGTIVDAHDAFAVLAETDTGMLKGGDYPEALDDAADFIWDELRYRWQKDDLGAESGIVYLAFERIAQSTTLSGGASFTGDNKDTLAVAFSKNPGRFQGPKQQYVRPVPLLVHELGHALYMGHAPTLLVSAKDPSGPEEGKAHLRYVGCAMNYDPDPCSEWFCALCLIKLRGWAVSKVDHNLHLVDDVKAVDEEAAARKAVTLFEEDATVWDDPAWARTGAAFVLGKTKAIADAKAALQKEAKDAEYAYEKWPKRARLRELRDKKEEERKKAEAKEFTKLDAEYKVVQAGCLNDKARILRERTKVRAATKELVAKVDQAAEDYKAKDPRFDQPLGKTMLRELALNHFLYGDVEKGHEYYKLLTERTTHEQDLGRLQYQVDGEGRLSLLPTEESVRYWSENLRNVKSHELRVVLELGDPDTLFAAAATTDEGKKARLQVLGLFGRPLTHPEAGDCFTFSWDYAKTLLPGLDADPKGVLSTALKDFLVEGGALPAPGDYAKLRTWGGMSVGYSQTSMMLRFPKEDFPESQGYQNGTHEAERPYSRFMLGGERWDIENAFREANPAFGKVPLVARVEKRPLGSGDDAWASAGKGLRVYFELLPPGTLPAWTDKAADAAKHPVAGGFSFIDQVVGPALATKPAAYLKARVQDYEPSETSDPQAQNVHAMIGGKRRLHGDGNISTPLFGAIENVLCAPRAAGFKGLPPAGTGTARPHQVCVDTDAQGRAEVVLSPSRVAGDRYRLRVYVGPPTKDVEGSSPEAIKAETGTLVVWRTVRVSRHVRQPGCATQGELPAYLNKDGVPAKLAGSLGALPDLDLKGAAAKELARAFCELILDPQALTPAPVKDVGPDLLVIAKEMGTKHKTLNRPSLCAQMSIFRCPLAPTVGDTTGTKLEVQLGAKTLEPGTVTIRPKGGGKDAAVASDEAAKDGALAPLKPDVVRGTVSYTTGKVTVEFASSQAGKDYDVCFYPTNLVDLDALLTFPDASPFLFNLKLPSDYNAAIKAGTLPMTVASDGKPGNHYMYTDDRAAGLCKNWLMQALVHAVDKNRGFYPGLVVIQAVALDSYSAIWPSGTQEGKAVGSGVYLFGKTVSSGLALHELSHALYLQHAPTAQGNKAHLHDAADTCVMSYDANDGDYCGQCVASLRGMTVEQEPFVPAE